MVMNVFSISAVNDIDLIRRMDAFDDDCIRATGLKAMLRHSWYLGQELATLALFSAKLSTQQKGQLLQTMATPRGPHLLAVLPRNVSELRISRSFFASTGIEASFIDLPVDTWLDSVEYKKAAEMVANLPCVNDSAEHGVALIRTIGHSTTQQKMKNRNSICSKSWNYIEVCLRAATEIHLTRYS